MPRLCELTTPLGDDLRFYRMRVSERLSRLFEIQLEAISERPDIAPKELLGLPVTVKVHYTDGEERYFNGYVTRFALGGVQGRFTHYRMTLHPWLWFLTRTADCRIFQGKNVPQILTEVFEDEGTKAVVDRISEPERYEAWDYCVQYRETDFNFITRMCEQEGIYWFCEHDQGKHTMVLLDQKGRHDPIKGESAVRYVTHTGTQVIGEDLVADWNAQEEIQTGKYLLGEYDFKKPGTNMGTERHAEIAAEHAKPSYDAYDYPGGYDTHGEGDNYVANRVEELNAQARTYTGRGRLRFFHVGRTFKLEEHPRDDQNGQYLITSTEYEFFDPAYESSSSGGSGYSCSFTAIRKDQQFRPPRLAAKPIIPGIQTAVVTGPGGEEIHTDEYGRVKVQFHWDRRGQKDDKTSCWLRVAFLMAGDKFGFVSIPRMGQEVVVSFLEGDPDRPLVTGMVYNGSHMPPWDLPTNKTQWGMLSRSTLKGAVANANALRFEDKKGEEQVWLHAEKNQDIEVENDETHWVGHDRTKTIDHDETVHVKHDRTETVDHNETITIGNDRTETVGRDESVTVQRHKRIKVAATHTEQVGQSMNITVGTTLTEMVGASYTETVGGAMTLSVGAALAVTVGAGMAMTIAGASATTVGGSMSASVGGDSTSEVGGNASETVKGERSATVTKDSMDKIGGAARVEVVKEFSLKAKKIQLNADDEIELKVGSAQVLLKKNGDITIKGGKINIKGSGNVTIKGSQIAEN